MLFNHRSAIRAAAVTAVLLLAACGRSGLSGTYGTLEKNDIQFVFSGDSVSITKSGDTVTGKYKVDGKTLAVLNPQGQSWSFKIDDKAVSMMAAF